MVSAAGVVAHFDLRVRNPARDHRLNFLRVHHKYITRSIPGLAAIQPAILTRITIANPQPQPRPCGFANLKLAPCSSEVDRESEPHRKRLRRVRDSPLWAILTQVYGDQPL